MKNISEPLLGTFEIPDMQSRSFDYLNAMAEQNRLKNNPVLQVFESLERYVKEFEADLDTSHEVGARLVSFGSTVTFHIRQISYSMPNIITFDGVTEDGNRVKLIQHVSQLSVLLLSMKIREEGKKSPIGFVHS